MQNLNKQLGLILKIGIPALLILMIIVLIVKRFIYFQPESTFVETKEPYQVRRNAHIYSWVLQGTNDKLIIFCHGNAGNISHREHKVSELNKLGYTVAIFDYSGYGKSGGIPTEQKCYDDASKMVTLLKLDYPRQNIIMYGESLGGPVATYVARRYKIPILILESALVSIKSLIIDKYRFLSFLAFLFPEFDTESFLYGYNGRTLMLHSVTDEIINFQTTSNIQTLSTRVIKMRGSHNNPQIPWDEIDKFILN
jgi:pimeloyl-ACP methyl ester carboxylesterase